MDAALLALLQQALAREGRFRWRLRGDSMTPALPPGCQIEIVPLPARVRLGDVIVFASGATLIAHRLVARGHNHWITQGDNRRAPDPPLRPGQALGLVSAGYRGGVRFWPRSPVRLRGLAWGGPLSPAAPAASRLALVETGSVVQTPVSGYNQRAMLMTHADSIPLNGAKTCERRL